MIISTEHIHISLKYIPDIQCWVVYHGISHKSLIVCHYLNINVEGRIWFWHGSNSTWNTLEMVYHVLDFGRNKIIAHNKKGGCNTIRYKIVFLNPDWLYFLQHMHFFMSYKYSHPLFCNTLDFNDLVQRK